jgi:energy-coupling factor transporter ATP-binding protein EcfA2
LRRLRAGEREIYIIGPSGSGKSSLIQAGVLPKVEGRAASPFFDAPFVVRTMRPTELPTERLVQTLGAATPGAYARRRSNSRPTLLREDAQMPRVRTWLEARRRTHRLAPLTP